MQTVISKFEELKKNVYIPEIDALESDSEGLSDPEEKINLHAGEFEVIFKNEQDRGVTLSMHQPWASLLVKGIKKVEGTCFINYF